MEARYRHKNVAFKVSVDNIENSHLRLKIFSALKDVFKGFSITDSEHIAMEFTFTDKISLFIIEQEFVRVKDIKVGKTQTHFKDNELNFLFDNSNPFKVIVLFMHPPLSIY